MSSKTNGAQLSHFLPETAIEQRQILGRYLLLDLTFILFNEGRDNTYNSMLRMLRKFFPTLQHHEQLIAIGTTSRLKIVLD